MAYDKNTDIENEKEYLNDLISQGGGEGEWAKSQINELTTYENSLQPEPVTFYSTDGDEPDRYAGFRIDGKTYKDKEGTQRIDSGDITYAGGQWWQMGDNGGIAIYKPDWLQEGYDKNNFYSANNSKKANSSKENLYPTFNNQYGGDLKSVIEAIQDYQKTNSMSTDESQARAYAQLNSMYNANFDKTLDSYNKNAISRGMFGQLPTEALKANAISESELNKSSAVNNLANDLYNQDYSRARQTDQDFL